MSEISLETILVLAKFKKLSDISGIIRPMLYEYAGRKNALKLLKAMTTEDVKEFKSLIKEINSEDDDKGAMTPDEIKDAAKAAKKSKAVKAAAYMELYNSDIDELVVKAKEIVVEQHEKFIYDIIHKQYSTYDTKLGKELYQCGVIGLLKALETYNVEKGALTTYSQFFIMHEISSQINFHRNDTTTYYNKVQTKIKEAIDKLTREGFEPSIRSISIMTDLGPDIVRRELECIENSNIQYLDAMEKPDTPGPYDATPEYIVSKEEQEKNMRESFKNLSELQQKILVGKHTGKTNQQMADENNITVGQVKSGYQKGIQVLRKDSNLREQYREYMLSAEKELNAYTPSPIVSKKEFELMIDNMLEIVFPETDFSAKK